MKSILLYTLLVLIAIPVSLAQSITSFSPADGAENVPLSTTVSVTFDTPIPASVDPEDIGFILEPVTFIFPEDEFEVNDVAISSNRLTITLSVSLTANTDYHFAFLGLPGDGVPVPLTQVFTTSFSTGTFAGNLSISGTLSYEMISFDFDDDWDDFDDHTVSSSKSTAQSTEINPFNAVTRLQSILERGTIERTHRSKSLSTLLDDHNMPDDEDLRRRTVVLITDQPVFFDDDDDDYWDDDEEEPFPTVFALTTVDAISGTYTAPRLTNGDYYVTALYLSPDFMASDDDNALGLVGFGSYTDENEEPLAVTLSGASVTDIDFTVFLLNANFFDDLEETAFGVFADVTAEVSAGFPNAKLYIVQGTSFWEETLFSGPFTPNGKSMMWLYQFLDTEQMIEVQAISIFGIVIASPSSSASGFDFAPLPNPADTTMIDSDVAVQVAIQNGAENLLQENRGPLSDWEVDYRLSRDTDVALDAGITIQTTNPFWLISFRFYPDDTDYIASVVGHYAIDAYTGAFLEEVVTTSIEETPLSHLPSAIELNQNYPNPFNPTTSIAFSLPSHTEVRLSIYDVAGREVMVLVDGSMPAGQHTVPFNSSGTLSSGVYVYRLQAGGEILTRKMTLIK
ncbi:MAG: T9SS type A sorting domain-containing protein [Balneolales bacterium]|nr:T9SS type A sorting domain-containing protein [Balneolales bacterium]